MAKTVDYTQLLRDSIEQEGTISNCFSLFHNYSLLNTLWIARQQMKMFGNITPIKGYKQWQQFNRRLKPEYATKYGQPKFGSAIEVLFPDESWYPVYDEDGNKKLDENGKVIWTKRPNGKFVSKWIHVAYSQTEILDPSKPDGFKDIADLKFDLDKLLNTLDIKLEDFNSIDGNCQGKASTARQVLMLNPVAARPMETALHEVAHCLLHQNTKLPRHLREVQAEGVVYIVGAMLKADESILSDARGYIQNWFRAGNETELTDKVTKPIIQAANLILAALDDSDKKDVPDMLKKFNQAHSRKGYSELQKEG